MSPWQFWPKWDMDRLRTFKRLGAHALRELKSPRDLQKARGGRSDPRASYPNPATSGRGGKNYPPPSPSSSHGVAVTERQSKTLRKATTTIRLSQKAWRFRQGSRDEWHGAKVIEVDLEREKVRVEWTFDGSSRLLSTCKVRQQLTEEALLNQQKRRWLRASWTLALLGPLRSRIVAALRVLGLEERAMGCGAW